MRIAVYVKQIFQCTFELTPLLFWVFHGRTNEIHTKTEDDFLLQRLLEGSPTNAQTAAYYVCFALQGVCSGTAMTQMIIVLSDWVGPERLAKSLAIMMVNLGLLYVPAQAVIGAFPKF